MSYGYSEDDTERARQQERAGQQPASSPPAPGYARPGPHAPLQQRHRALALALIGLGMIMLAQQVLPGSDSLTGSMVLFIISGCFWFFALWRRIFGLMIPGAILAGIGLGIPFAEFSSGASVVWGLALAFMTIAVLGRAIFNVRSAWAVIPAVILFGVGLIITVLNLPQILGAGVFLGPLLLVGLGLWLSMNRRRAP